MSIETIDVRQASDPSGLPRASLLIFGSANVDITARAAPSARLVPDTTIPGAVSISMGGISRNMAEAAHRCLLSRAIGDQEVKEDRAAATLLVSVRASDALGSVLQASLKDARMRTDGLVVASGLHDHTAVCSMVLDDFGALALGVADMEVVVRGLITEVVLSAVGYHRPRVVALDANLAPEPMSALLRHCVENDIIVLYEPTSTSKAPRIIPALLSALSANSSPARFRAPLNLTTPNIAELLSMYKYLDGSVLTSHPSAEPELAQQHTRMMDARLVRLLSGNRWLTDLTQLAALPASDDEGSDAADGRGNLGFLISLQEGASSTSGDDINAGLGVAHMAIRLLSVFQCLVVTCGELGVVVVQRHSQAHASNDINVPPWTHATRSDITARTIIAHDDTSIDLFSIMLQHFPAPHVSAGAVVSVTGAGDTLAGSLLADLVLSGRRAFGEPRELEELIMRAQRAAVKTLRSALAVAPDLG